MSDGISFDVTLPPELSRFVDRCVASGRYASTNDVVCEALRVLRAREVARVASNTDLRSEVEAGLLQLSCGEGVDGEEFFARLRSGRR